MGDSSTLSLADKAKFFGYLFQIGGLISVAFCFWLGFERIETALSHESTQGTVVGHVVRQRVVRGRNMSYPVVSYRTKAGDFVIEGGMGSEQPEYSQGQVPSVLYPPEKPARGQIGNYAEMWFAVLVRGAVAVFLFVAGWAAFKVPGMIEDPQPAPEHEPARV